MKTDTEIQQDVIDQLKWNLFLKASEIGVSVRNGIVTLSGQVDSLLKKLEAEKEAKKVAGVRAIAEDIRIGVSPANKRTDSEIAEAVLRALKWHTSVNEENLKIKVEDGIVTLEGEVEWGYQREAARNVISNLNSVCGIINNITLEQKTSPKDLKKRINAALHRSAILDARKIHVDVIDNKAILKGQVRSFSERESAEDAVWAAPGVLSIENNLEVEEPHLAF